MVVQAAAIPRRPAALRTRPLGSPSDISHCRHHHGTPQSVNLAIALAPTFRIFPVIVPPEGRGHANTIGIMIRVMHRETRQLIATSMSPASRLVRGPGGKLEAAAEESTNETNVIEA